MQALKLLYSLGLLVLTFLFLSTALAADYSKEVRTLESYRVEKAPVLDGRFDEPAWQGALRTGDFRLRRGEGLSKAKTEIMTCWDTESLYIAYICYEPKMQELVEHYSGYQGPHSWSLADEVELFIRPFGVGYFQICSSAAGEIYYSPRSDKWTWDIKVKTAKFQDRWQVEMAVPFAELKGYHCAMTPSDGDWWGITFARLSLSAGDEWSSWNAGTFHGGGPYGRLVFKEKNPLLSLEVTTGVETAVGNKVFEARVRNMSGAAGDVDMGIRIAGQEPRVQLSLAPGEEQKVKMPYVISEPGTHSLGFFAMYDGAVVKKGLIVHPVESLAEPLEEALKAAESYLEDFPSDPELVRFEREASKVLQQWNASLLQIEQVAPPRWKELQRRAEELLEGRAELFTRVGKARIPKQMSSLWGAQVEGTLEYGVGVEDNMSKVRPDDIFEGEIKDLVSLSLARNEYEGIQIIICPLEKDLKDVRVEVSELEGPGGQSIPRDNIRVRPVGYVEVMSFGLWPDPLLELDSFSCEKGKLQPVWIDVHAPQGQSPGLYRGKIRVLPANSHPLELTMEVRVWDFTIPRHSSLRLDYWFWTGPASIEQYYKKKFTLEDFEKYARFLGSYRMPASPLITHLWGRNLIKVYREGDGTFTVDFSQYDPYLKAAVANGMNVFSYRMMPWGKLPTYDRTTGQQVVLKGEQIDDFAIEVIKQTAEHLKEAEWFDYSIFVFNDFDEIQPRGKGYERMKQFHTRLKEVVPDLPRTFAMNTLSVEAFKDYVEIFIPVIERIKPETIEELKQSGYEVWWYTMGYRQFPDYLIDQHSTDHRIIAWMNWKYGVSGCLRWAVNRWGLFFTKKPWVDCGAPFVGTGTVISEDPEERWPNVPWKIMGNSSSYLFYPGPYGDPWASIRMENHRDGFEDYEYLKLLKETIEQLEKQSPEVLSEEELTKACSLLEIPEKLIKSRAREDYTHNPEELLAYRNRIGDAIEQLRPLLSD